jgi:hypothetical protein
MMLTGSTRWIPRSARGGRTQLHSGGSSAIVYLCVCAAQTLGWDWSSKLDGTFKAANQIAPNLTGPGPAWASTNS